MRASCAGLSDSVLINDRSLSGLPRQAQAVDLPRRKRSRPAVAVAATNRGMARTAAAKIKAIVMQASANAPFAKALNGSRIRLAAKSAPSAIQTVSQLVGAEIPQQSASHVERDRPRHGTFLECRETHPRGPAGLAPYIRVIGDATQPVSAAGKKPK
jgi:hypothetical protein